MMPMSIRKRIVYGLTVVVCVGVAMFCVYEADWRWAAYFVLVALWGIIGLVLG